MIGTIRIRQITFLLYLLLVSSLLFVQVDDLLIPISFFTFLYTLRYVHDRRLDFFLKFIVFMFGYSVIVFVINMVVYSDISFVKSFTNAVSVFLLISSSYYLGREFESLGDRETIISAIKALGFVNSIINLYSWFSTTGGVVGRYNFASIINGSVSGNIGISIIAALFFLTGVKNSRFYSILGFIVCSSNVLIIITRLKQVLYIVYLVVFYFASNYHEVSIIRKLVRLITVVVIIVSVVSVFSSALSVSIKMYSNMFDSGAIDNIQRNLAVIDAKQMLVDSYYLGVGYGSFSFFATNTVLASPHGGFYSILSEFGFAGIVVMCFFLFKALFMGIKALLKASDRQLIACSIIICCEVLLFISSNSSFIPPANERSYYLSSIIMWLIMGVQNAFYSSSIDVKKKED